MDPFQSIRVLVSKAKLQEATQNMLDLPSSHKDAVTLIQTQLTSLKNRELTGVISFQDLNLSRNKIAARILDLLSLIEEEQANQEVSVPSEEEPIKIIDPPIYEKLMADNAFLKIDWLAQGLEKAKSVCKIHTSAGYIGTGFLVQGGFIFTNNHVIASAAIAQYSEIEFGYDNPEVNSVRYRLDHTQFHTLRALDYTKVKVIDNPEAPLAQWGVLEINPIIPQAQDTLLIIQHPRGRPKELAFSDGNISTWEHRLHYEISTEPGSSGSPVFDIHWNVVAIHHAGGNIPVNGQGDIKYVNEGILFKYIEEDLSQKNPTDAQQVEQTGPPTIKVEKPIKTILVYNIRDKKYADDLDAHLIMQKRQNHIRIFDIQKDIPADADKKEALDKALKEASMVLVLISPNLYRPDTLEIALEVEDYVSQKRVIPIKLVPFDIKSTPFAKLMGLPMHVDSIKTSQDSDTTLYEIAQQITRVIQDILNP